MRVFLYLILFFIAVLDTSVTLHIPTTFILAVPFVLSDGVTRRSVLSRFYRYIGYSSYFLNRYRWRDSVVRML
jgi:hypothetical protein